ncbi:DUF4817 domain-containing protein [Trichonephila clavipes]|nr:DUF4817 domain-containing protein [Trichonephila clavipes]
MEWFVFPPVCVSNMLSSRQQRAFAVEAYFSNSRSVIAVQRAFRRHFNIPPRGHVPDRKFVSMWMEQRGMSPAKGNNL